MIRLYRKNSDGLEYWETWEADGKHTIHSGQAGYRGKSETVRGSLFRSSAKTIDALIAEKKKEGFYQIPNLETMIIEFTIRGRGTPEDLEKRHRLEDRMNETLGWTGLGHCDGGRIGSGTMEVRCFVVNFEIAAKSVTADLAGTEFSRFSRIYRRD
ncbi:hypothetical protein [Oleiharenicola lentus]|uniref:hypothetical protein n=1 Tax=Oleiharenicola lentus TaxID=2508720 RepID=UPI003F67FE3A